MKKILSFMFFSLLAINVFGVEVMTSDNFTVEANKEYRWLVKRGDLNFRISDNKLMFVVDAKGEKSCYLTVQDALDVYSILQQFGQYLFEKSDPSIKYTVMVTQESENSFSWNIEGKKLKVYLNQESNYLQIEYPSNKPIPLNIGLISEIAQSIGIIIKNASTQKS